MTLVSFTAAAMLAAGPSSAAVTGAGASVNPTFHSGRCPVVFKFKGTIQSNSGGEVKYKWIRSDGATAPVQSLMFRGPGTRTIGGETWELSPPHFHGWEAIEIVSPNKYVSNRATFELSCK